MLKLTFNIMFIFLYYLICIWIYIIYNNSQNKKIKIHEKSLNDKLKKVLEVEIYNFDNDKEINEENMMLLKKNLKSKKYQKITIKSLLDFGDRNKMISFINKTKLTDIVLDEKDKDEFDKAYKIYIIGEFKNQNYYNYLIKSCEDNSINIEINALRALTKLGNEKYFLKGLKTITKSSSLINEKVIVDSIDSFYEDNKKINQLLEKELNANNKELKKIILNHFTNTRNIQAKKTVYNLLSNINTDKEVKIACMRYFENVKYGKARDLLIKLLKDENWEIRAVSANILSNYNYEGVIKSLKESVKDKIWYVRRNSAKSLCELVKDKKDLILIMNAEDKYASDAIRSILSEEENIKICFELDLNLEKDLVEKEFVVSSV